MKTFNNIERTEQDKVLDRMRELTEEKFLFELEKEEREQVKKAEKLLTLLAIGLFLSVAGAYLIAFL